MKHKLKSLAQYEARAKIAKALAHASRLMMLDLLHAEEMSVNDLTQHVQADQSTVSKHLAVLKAAGLVASRKDGSTSYYRVTCSCLDGFFGCLEAVLDANLKAQREACK